MAWIESHQSLGNHPKLLRLARLLRVSRVVAAGHLHFLWWWALDYSQAGDITAFDNAEIAEAALWKGDPQRFASALHEAGFIDRFPDRTALHDWNDYAGKLIERRARNRERMQRARAQDVQDTCNAQDAHVQGTLRARAKLPYPTIPTIPTEPYQPYQPEPTEPRDASGASAAGDGESDWLDLGFRDRYGTLLTAIGERVSEKNRRACQAIAEDMSQQEIDAALKQCVLDNVRPWPSNVMERIRAAAQDEKQTAQTMEQQLTALQRQYHPELTT